MHWDDFAELSGEAHHLLQLHPYDDSMYVAQLAYVSFLYLLAALTEVFPSVQLGLCDISVLGRELFAELGSRLYHLVLGKVLIEPTDLTDHMLLRRLLLVFLDNAHPLFAFHFDR